MSNQPPPPPPPMPPAFPPPDEGPGGFGSLPPPPPPTGGWGGAVLPPPPGGPGGRSYGLPDDGATPAGIPWEREGTGWLSRWWQNTSMTLFSPDAFFTAMPVSGGHGKPLMYTLISGILGAILTMICQLPLNGLQILAEIGNANQGTDPVVMVIAVILGAICGALAMPLFVIIGIYIMAGLYHVALVVLGGARNGFEATFRVVCYTTGAMAIPNAIPCLNCFAGIYALVLTGLGLVRAHGCEVWQAVVAIVLVFALCILSVVAIYAALFAAIMAAIASGGA